MGNGDYTGDLAGKGPFRTRARLKPPLPKPCIRLRCTQLSSAVTVCVVTSTSIGTVRMEGGHRLADTSRPQFMQKGVGAPGDAWARPACIRRRP
jgi:hypothetical protein